jgi:hypothetical protein
MTNRPIRMGDVFVVGEAERLVFRKPSAGLQPPSMVNEFVRRRYRAGP